MNLVSILIIAGACVLGLILILWVLATMFRKVGPNEALIVYGWGGTQVVKGGGRIVWPLIQTYEELSLELMSFDVVPGQSFYTSQGVAVDVEAIAQLKVKSDMESILTAAEQFLTKSIDERQSMIKLVMEGHLRGIIGLMTVEQIVKEPETVGDKVRGTCSEDLAKMGLELVSFTIKEVKDENEYIVNMGKPEIAKIKKQADMAIAEAERDTAIRRAETEREAAVAKAQADQERTVAQTLSETRQAEATRDLNLKQAEYQASVQTAQAQADKAYEIQTNIMEQQVTAEKVRVRRVEKEEQVKVEEAEIARKEKELIATVLKAAEIEKRKIQALAEAERDRIRLEAIGKAEATKTEGLAEAEILKAKGEAEANAIQAKADAYADYSQAAILDKLLAAIPAVAQSFADSLSRVDKITIVSTGDGSDAGLNKITGDVSKMVAQTPALVETLTGMSIGQLLNSLPGLKSQTGSKQPEG
ncbi:MAG TPA: SPFH domain-containing protein [Desulfobacteria bacterium]|nr:SPFH domain-containing protein [Desulfobacteria bacterium]